MEKENDSIKEARRRQAIEKAHAMRYKKPMLAELGWCEISEKLSDIAEECSNVHYWFDDDDSLTAAFDGDEDEAWEFKMVYSDIEASVERLTDELNNITDYDDDFEQTFNGCTVALIGNRYNTLGYDDYEEDYFSLTSYETGLAATESGKRLSRLTKAEMISRIGQCMGIVMAAADIFNRYQNIEYALDILRGTNKGILDTIDNINRIYDEAAESGDYVNPESYKMLIRQLPERIWVE